MGKLKPQGYEAIRSGEAISYRMVDYTNVASLTAKGITAANSPGRLVYLRSGGTGSIPCMAVSDGSTWRKIDFNGNAG